MTQHNTRQLSEARLYEVIRKPVVTEKATIGQENNQVTFEVALDADKREIRKAVQQLFGVTVVNVNTHRLKGKQVSWRGQAGKRSDKKKAIVSLKEGDSIDIMTGI